MSAINCRTCFSQCNVVYVLFAAYYCEFLIEKYLIHEHNIFLSNQNKCFKVKNQIIEKKFIEIQTNRSSGRDFLGDFKLLSGLYIFRFHSSFHVHCNFHCVFVWARILVAILRMLDFHLSVSHFFSIFQRTILRWWIAVGLYLYFTNFQFYISNDEENCHTITSIQFSAVVYLIDWVSEWNCRYIVQHVNTINNNWFFFLWFYFYFSDTTCCPDRHIGMRPTKQH